MYHFVHVWWEKSQIISRAGKMQENGHPNGRSKAESMGDNRGPQ